jgi:hypothetical protein
MQVLPRLIRGISLCSSSVQALIHVVRVVLETNVARRPCTAVEHAQFWC